MTDNFIERKVCPVCASSNLKSLLSISFNDNRIANFIENYYQNRIDISILASKPFEISKCVNCELLFQRYILNNSLSYQLYEHWISREESLAKKENAAIDIFIEYAKKAHLVGKIIRKEPHDTKVLEYGMGWGYCLRTMAAFNFNVQGYELSESRIMHARKLGLNVIDDLNTADSYFDYIYANQVFEHIENPRETILKLCELLAPNGVLNINVPQGRGMENKLKNKDWIATHDACHPLEHINCFNRTSLKALGKEASMRVIKPNYFYLGTNFRSIAHTIARNIYDYTIGTNLFFKKID